MAIRNSGLGERSGVIGAGEKAPQFTLLDQDRNAWKLSEAVENGDVVLCFYPMDFSPVCSVEMKCATAEFERFAAHAAQVVGISCDSFFTHKAWAEAEGVTVPLLADMHREVCKAYGVYFEDLHTAGRATVIVGGDGVVKWSQQREIEDAMEVDEVLAAIG